MNGLRNQTERLNGNNSSGSDAIADRADLVDFVMSPFNLRFQCSERIVEGGEHRECLFFGAKLERGEAKKQAFSSVKTADSSSLMLNFLIQCSRSSIVIFLF